MKDAKALALFVLGAAILIYGVIATVRDMLQDHELFYTCLLCFGVAAIGTAGWLLVRRRRG